VKTMPERPVEAIAPPQEEPVAVDVPAGTDHVVFRFHGYGDYPEWLALSALTLPAIALAPRSKRRRPSSPDRRGGTAG
jgi:hypothetical protein